MRSFESPADWIGAELQPKSDQWISRLSDGELGELDAAIHRLERAAKPLPTIRAADFPLETLQPKIADWVDRLRSGLGFVLVRGFPVGGYTKAQAELAYWLIGQHMGTPVPQNAAQDLLGHVRDDGADPHDKNTRLYRTRAGLSFHTDGADVTGLLCLGEAKSGGVSRICSSVHVYNEIVRRRPDLASLLTEPFQHHAHGQFGPKGPKTFPAPIVTLEDGRFRMFLLLWYIRNAAADFPDVAKLSRDQLDLLDLLEALPEEEGVALDMSFQLGDMQFLDNRTILHARTEYQDWSEPNRKRHLLRLWLSLSKER